VQPSARQDLPHTHARGIHWISTAAAVGAVVAAAVLVAPAGAAQSTARAADGSTVQNKAAHGARPPAATASPAAPATTPATSPATPAAAPDPTAATYPLTCAGGARPDVVSQVSGDLDGDGGPETAVVVRCHSDTGTPPSGVYVLSAPAEPGGAPRVAVTLVKPQDNRQIQHFRLEGSQVKATVLGFSSDDVPQCCPDMSRTYTWEWRGDRYVALPGPPPDSI
jgi:hypothetical protein